MTTATQGPSLSSSPSTLVHSYSNRYIDQFSASVLNAYSQLDTPLLKVVKDEKFEGDHKLLDIIKFIGNGRKRERKGNEDLTKLHTPDEIQGGVDINEFHKAQLDLPSHRRRVMTRETFYYYTATDPYDIERSYNDPTSIYATGAAGVMSLRYNDEIYASITGYANEQIRKNFSRSCLPSTSLMGATNKSNIWDKIKEAQVQFNKYRVPKADRFFICSSDTEALLLNASNNASSDYKQALGINATNGMLTHVLGFNILIHDPEVTPKIPIDNKDMPTMKTCLGVAIQKNAVALGKGKPISVSLEKHARTHLMTEIYVNFSFGCVRVYDKGVIALHA